MFSEVRVQKSVKMRNEERPNIGTLHITVMGSSQVGKSALAVRYLTKRFIGEYRSDSGKHPNFHLAKFLHTTLIAN